MSKNIKALQNSYRDFLILLIKDGILDTDIEAIRVEEMTCDDFTYGLQAVLAIVNLDLDKKRKDCLVKEEDSHLVALRKTDKLLNEFHKNLFLRKKLDSIIYQHKKYIEMDDGEVA